MEELPEELKTMMHHILHRHKFYRLQINQYHEILHLLHQPRTEDPHLIQQYVFSGIVAFNMLHKDQIAPVLSSPAFAQISMESKTLLHRILHEFHFLNCIRAFEMFQERFQQPASLSQAHGVPGLPFDDEFEKARLHYMYYGPYSIYHMGGMMQQQPLSAPYQPYFTPPPQTPLEEPSRMRIEKIEEERALGPARGRPPRERKRELQRLIALKITPTLKGYLQAKHRGESLLEERDQQLQFCVCRGFLNSNDTYCCPQCSNYYHTACCKKCMGCAMRERDPFSKVVQTIGLYFLDWWGEDYTFEEQLNMKSLQRVCSTGRFQVMLSCMTPEREDITWPDGAVFSLNGQQVFEVPPLFLDHALSHRRDTAHFITSYVFQPRTDSSVGLERMRLGLTANTVYSLQYRDNRKNMFLLGVFLVEKVTPEALLTSIIAQSRPDPTINPLEQESNRGEVQIDRIALSCFDPYSRDLIETPVRGADCMHFDCFDLQTYLTLQNRLQQRSWRCPLCGGDARHLRVDKFQLRVIEEIRDLPRLPARVTYHRDGKIDLEEGEASADPSLEEPY